MDKKDLDKLGATVARQQSMGDGEVFPHGSRLYRVETGWKSFMMEKDSTVICVETMMAFEEAVCSPEVTTIFVPASAAITEDLMERVCQRHAVAKTIYKEVKEEPNDTE